ncbi:hypothetical protein ACFYQ5_23130 [Streptomyces sp. NPDC005794]|uniref:hypothetical protein n=1 Tax=Streptomyces sp. NPDC005794 TaxID=3364733 RepID=UPI00369F9637
MPDAPECHDVKMVIVHVMSLMVADELECENNADPPDSMGMTEEEKRDLLSDIEANYTHGVTAARQPMKVN